MLENLSNGSRVVPCGTDTAGRADMTTLIVSLFVILRTRIITFVVSTNCNYQVKVKVSHNRSRWSKGFRVGYDPGFSWRSALRGWWVVSLTHRPPLPQQKSLVVIFRGWVDPRAHGSVGSYGKKIPSDTIGNRYRARPTSSAVHCNDQTYTNYT